MNPVVAAEDDPGAKAIYRHTAAVPWRSVIAFGDREDLPPGDWIEISRAELERLAETAIRNGGRK